MSNFYSYFKWWRIGFSNIQNSTAPLSRVLMNIDWLLQPPCSCLTNVSLAAWHLLVIYQPSSLFCGLCWVVKCLCFLTLAAAHLLLYCPISWVLKMLCTFHAKSKLSLNTSSIFFDTKTEQAWRKNEASLHHAISEQSVNIAVYVFPSLIPNWKEYFQQIFSSYFRHGSEYFFFLNFKSCIFVSK